MLRVRDITAAVPSRHFLITSFLMFHILQQHHHISVAISFHSGSPFVSTSLPILFECLPQPERSKDENKQNLVKVIKLL